MENSKEVKVESVSAINSQNQDVALTAVPVSGSLKINFSEAVDKETVNVNNVRVYEVDGNVPVSIAASNIKLSADGKTATVDLTGSVSKEKEYKVEIKNVKTADNKTVESKTVNFKTAGVAVVSTVTLSAGGSNPATGNNAPTNTNRIEVAYDAKLSPSTVTTSNVSLVDESTGKKVPINLSVTGGSANTIQITTDSVLPDGKQYTVSVSNVKTATGEDAEAVTKTFAVAAATPLAGTQTLTTLDGKTAGTGANAVWPKLTSGTTEAGAYNAGLELKLGNAVDLDEASVKENVQLVEKGTDTVVPTTITYNKDANIITIVPKSDLKESTDYEVQVKGGLKSNKGIYLDAANKNKVVTGETKSFTTLDVTAPTVESVTAKNGESNLKVNETQEFTVKLSEPVTLTTGNVVLAKTAVDFNSQTSITSNRVLATDIQVTKVPGTDATYSVKVAANKLDRNGAYKLVVVGKDLENTVLVTGANSVTAVADAAGNKLKKSTTTAFTTEGVDVTAPKITNVYKGSDIKEADKVTTATNVKNGDVFTFESDKKLASVDSNKVKVQQLSGSTWSTVSGSAVANVTNSAGDIVGLKVTLGGLGADAKYRIVLEEGAVTDTVPAPNANKNTQEKVFEFIGTAGNDAASNVDIVAGTATGGNVTAAVDQSAVPVNNKIFIGFDENKIFEVAPSQVKVTDAEGNAVAGTLKEATGDYTGLKTGKQYVFTPSADLKNSTVYTVTVEGVKDEIGNTIAKKTIQFKTAAGDVKVSEVSVANGDQAVDRQKTITAKLNQKGTLAVGTAGSLNAGQISLTTKAAPNTNVTGLKVTKVNDTDFNIDFNKLAANTDYVLTIKTAGETKTINFTTGIQSTDVVKPALSQVEGQAYQDANTVVNFTSTATDNGLDFQFSKNIKSATVAIENLTDASPEAKVSVVSTTVATNTLNATLSKPLTAGHTYRITLSDVKDNAGNVTDKITVNAKVTAQ